MTLHEQAVAFDKARAAAKKEWLCREKKRKEEEERKREAYFNNPNRIVRPAPGLKLATGCPLTECPDSPEGVDAARPYSGWMRDSEDSDAPHVFEEEIRSRKEAEAKKAQTQEAEANKAQTQKTEAEKPDELPKVSPYNCSQPLPNLWVHRPHQVKSKRWKARHFAPEQGQDDTMIPEGKWLPANSSISPNVSLPSTKISPANVKHKPNRLSSETKGSRLLQGYLTYRDAKGVTRTGRVALDTQSNGCYALPSASLPRRWRPWEARSVMDFNP